MILPSRTHQLDAMNHSTVADWICGSCQEKITSQCLSAFGKRYHLECFVCAQCQTSVQGKQCLVKDDKVMIASIFVCV